MRVLVTGGAGFVGTRLVKRLLDEGDHLLVVDDLRVGGPHPTESGRLTFVEDSLGSSRATEAIGAFAPEVTFHLAALHVIPYCEANPDEAYEVNVNGTKWLLATLRETPCSTLVAASSAAVYGFSDDPLTEDDPIRPSSVYGETKVSMEELLREEATSMPDVRVVTARLFNVFGPGDYNPHVIPTLIDQVLAGGDVRLGNVWPKRDYIHVEDVTRALVGLVDGAPGLHVYNVATGHGTSVKDVCDTTGDLLQTGVSVITDPDRVRSDDGHLVGDSTRLHQATGWWPRLSVRDGIAELLALRGAAPPASPERALPDASWDHPVVNVLGLDVSIADHELLREHMRDAVESRTSLAITFANPNYVMEAQRDPGLLAQINAFDMVLADGWGVVLAARMLGKPLPTRMANDDITDTIFGLTAQEGWRLFLFGSAPGVAERAGHNLRDWFPGLDVVGSEHGYWDVERGTPGQFHDEDVDRIVDTINATRPDFLVVGVPTPLQQVFVTENRHRLEVPVILTGGSYLDHLAERRDWFPPWVMQMRMGWLYRLSRDPRRLWYRYSVELADYFWRVSKQAAQVRATNQ